MKDKKLEWWDKFYTDLESGLAKYTRPANWKERALSAENSCRKPVRNQSEGLSRWGKEYE